MKDGTRFAWLVGNTKRLQWFPTDECSVWPFAYAGSHPQLGCDGRIVTAHRVVLWLVDGPCPDGMEGCHSCGNSRCVNPRHLRWDTRQANVQDQRAHGVLAVGDRHGMASFTLAEVAEIRRAASAGATSVALAKEYGASRGTVRGIIVGRTYRDAPGPIAPRSDRGGARGAYTLQRAAAGMERIGKIDWDTAREIRRRASAGQAQKDIASDLGLHPRLVGRVVRGETWRPTYELSNQAR